MATTTITVFGSGRVQEGDPRYETAYRVGRLIGREGWRLCNGGYGGTMEASAKGAKEAGGATLGILCRPFGTAPNRWIDNSIVCESLVERLVRLIREGDACLILPGGTGTLLELSAAWELRNKNLVTSFPVVAVGEFWSPVLELLTRELRREGRYETADVVTTVRTPEEAVVYLGEKLKGRSTNATR